MGAWISTWNRSRIRLSACARTCTARRSKGFSLLEVLIAASVSSVGLGGITALLLVNGVRTTQSLYETRASLLASDAVELLALAGSEEFLQSGLNGWQARATVNLPDGQGVVCRDASPDDGDLDDPACDGSGLTVVKLFWTEQDQPRRLVLETTS